MLPYPLSPTTGTIPPDKIVGRLTEIEQLKTLLNAQSVVIDEIRRMGKTLLLQKFAYLSVTNEEPNRGIYFTFQGTNDVNALTDVLLNELRQESRHGWLKVSMNRCLVLYRQFTGTKVDMKYQDVGLSFALPAFRADWKKAFRACIEDLADHQTGQEQTLTLIFDELPMMLWEWINAGKGDEAKAFLDLLRDIRQSLKQPARIRFIFCGSIGMEVVLEKLRREHKYTGEAFNDTYKFSLPPMSAADAMFLGECFYLSGFRCDHEQNKAAYITTIAQQCDFLPYFINAVFLILQIDFDATLSEENIALALNSLLNQAGSSDDIFRQLSQRLTIYYPDEQGKQMRACLNLLAKSADPVAEEALKTSLPYDEADTQQALDILWRDDFLNRSLDAADNRYFGFRYSLIKRWWKRNQA